MYLLEVTRKKIIFCWHLEGHWQKRVGSRAESGAGFGSVSHRCGYEDPHPNPYQNVTDPEHWYINEDYLSRLVWGCTMTSTRGWAARRPQRFWSMWERPLIRLEFVSFLQIQIWSSISVHDDSNPLHGLCCNSVPGFNTFFRIFLCVLVKNCVWTKCGAQ